MRKKRSKRKERTRNRRLKDLRHVGPDRLGTGQNQRIKEGEVVQNISKMGLDGVTDEEG